MHGCNFTSILIALAVSNKSDRGGLNGLQNATFPWWKSDGGYYLNKMILHSLIALYLDRRIPQIDPKWIDTRKDKGDKHFIGLIILINTYGNALEDISLF